MAPPLLIAVFIAVCASALVGVVVAWRDEYRPAAARSPAERSREVQDRTGRARR